MSDDHADPLWITALAKASLLIGMNPTQTRWRLVRWNEHRKVPKSERPSIPQPVREHAAGTTTALALVILAAFARQWIAQGGGLGLPTIGQLLDFGAHAPADEPDEWWRLYTAALLHIGVLHLVFNLVALASVGPAIEKLWGGGTMLFLFFTTAVAGNLVSGAFHPDAVSAGASGGICGLIGAAAGWGHMAKTGQGIAIRNAMLRWLAYTIIIGFGIHANNYAHAGGAAAGVLFGVLVKPAAWNRHRGLQRVAGAIAVVATLAALAYILTRHGGVHGKMYNIDLSKVCLFVHRC